MVLTALHSQLVYLALGVEVELYILILIGGIETCSKYHWARMD